MAQKVQGLFLSLPAPLDGVQARRGGLGEWGIGGARSGGRGRLLGFSDRRRSDECPRGSRAGVLPQIALVQVDTGCGEASCGRIRRRIRPVPGGTPLEKQLLLSALSPRPNAPDPSVECRRGRRRCLGGGRPGGWGAAGRRVPVRQGAGGPGQAVRRLFSPFALQHSRSTKTPIRPVCSVRVDGGEGENSRLRNRMQRHTHGDN